MIREKFLIPISKEHHDFLILAQLLKKDVPDYKGLPTELTEKVKYAKEKFISLFKPHYLLEQKLFDFLKSENEKFLEILFPYEKEHDQLEKFINDLSLETAGEDELDKIGHLISNHIRNEERKLFPELQKKLSLEQKNKIEKLLYK